MSLPTQTGNLGGGSVQESLCTGKNVHSLDIVNDDAQYQAQVHANESSISGL